MIQDSLSCRNIQCLIFYFNLLQSSMMRQHQVFREEAQIYSAITGKKCSIYHEQCANQQPTMAPHAKRYSGGKHQKSFLQENSLQKQKLRRKSILSSNSNKDQIFFNALRRGIKISLQPKPLSFSRTTHQHSNKQQIPLNKHQNSVQKHVDPSPKRQAITLEPIEHPTPFNSKKSQILTLQSNSKKVNYLSLNKILATKQTKKVEPLQMKGKDLFDKSKKQRLIFQRKNRQQSALQEQIRIYHEKTKLLLQQMRDKHHLKIKNPKKGKPSTNVLEQSEVFDITEYMNKQGVKFDKLNSQIAQIDKKYKRNNQKLMELEQSISNNQFNIALKSLDMPEFQQEKPEESLEEKDYLQQQQSIIYKLKASLLKIKQEKEGANEEKSIKANQRIKDLLFQ